MKREDFDGNFIHSVFDVLTNIQRKMGLLDTECDYILCRSIRFLCVNYFRFDGGLLLLNCDDGSCGVAQFAGFKRAK